MKQQTAVEWFFENLNSHKIQLTANKLFEQAKQMEKEQIMNAYKCGRLEINRVQHDFLTKEEKHYDETYNPNTKFQHKNQ
jgi:hypothetical protein